MSKTILVVDDFGSIRELLCKTLHQKGYETLSAENGKVAYKTLEEQSGEIDLVLSDFNMPEMNGMELLREIRKTPAIKEKPVIFLTTESQPDKMREAKELGLSAWITKPYKLSNFLSRIEYALK